VNQVRVNELARELEVRAKAIIDLLPEFGFTEKTTHSSSIPADVAGKVCKRIAGPDAWPTIGVELERRALDRRLNTGPRAASRYSLEAPATSRATVATTPGPSQQDMGDSCVCGGENENCRFCFGSGRMENRLMPAFPRRPFGLF